MHVVVASTIIGVLGLTRFDCLSQLRFASGIDFDFGKVDKQQLGPGERIVVVQNLGIHDQIQRRD